MACLLRCKTGEGGRGEERERVAILSVAGSCPWRLDSQYLRNGGMRLQVEGSVKPDILCRSFYRSICKVPLEVVVELFLAVQVTKKSVVLFYVMDVSG